MHSTPPGASTLPTPPNKAVTSAHDMMCRVLAVNTASTLRTGQTAWRTSSSVGAAGKADSQYLEDGGLVAFAGCGEGKHGDLDFAIWHGRRCFARVRL